MTTVELPLSDGRRARRERGRIAVLDAMVDLLLDDGQSPPSVEAIAARAGVSVASVFRYFESLEDLQRQTTGRFFERYAGQFEVADIGQGLRGERIERYVRARLGLYQTIAPIARFTRVRSSDHPQLAANLSQMRQHLAQQVRTHFDRELRRHGRADRDDIVGSVATLTSFEAWDMLHSEFRRSRAQIQRAWTRGLDAML